VRAPLLWYTVCSMQQKSSKFTVYGSVHRKYIPIYIQQDATLHSLFYLKTALHVLGGTSTHHQEGIQLYLQHLVFVTPLLLPAAIVEELELHLLHEYGWRYHPKHVEQFPDINKLCKVASCWIYIRI